MSTENNINMSSLNTNEFSIVRDAMGDWNNYGNESGFFTGHAMKNSPCDMETNKDYWYVTNICMSIDAFATQTAVNAFTKDTFIRNRESGVWKEWSKLGNGCDADTVDGKHAIDIQNYDNLTNKPVTLPTYTSYRQFPNYSGVSPIAVYEDSNTWITTLVQIFNMIDYENVGFIYIPDANEIEELYNQKVRPDDSFDLGETLELPLGIPMYVFTKSRYNMPPCYR